MKLIIQYLFNMLPYMFYSLPLFLVLRLIYCRILRNRSIRSNVLREFGILIFWLYLVGLFSQAIIPMAELSSSVENSINLIPFKVFLDTWREMVINHNLTPFIINLAGNIAVFIPLGFFVPLLWKNRRLKHAALVSFMISLIIELCQLTQSRCSDIDDLWLNTLGGVIGYGIYFIINRKYYGFFERFKADRD